MSKRFTETTKWENPWFRRLPPKLKCLWNYLCERCDHAGVIDLDYDMASFCIGAEVKASDLAALADNVCLLPNGKVWLPKFVRFQFGALSRDCKPHTPVFAALERHGLKESDLDAPEKVAAKPARPAPAPAPNGAPVAGKPDVKLAAARALYDLYPRKQGRAQALAAIRRALDREDIANLTAATLAYREAVALWNDDDRKFIPHPATWFNGERYHDDPETWVRSRLSGNNRVGAMTKGAHANGF